jgi:hypothetical protein
MPKLTRNRQQTTIDLEGEVEETPNPRPEPTQINPDDHRVAHGPHFHHHHSTQLGGNPRARGEEKGEGGGGAYKGGAFRRQWHMELSKFPREPARAHAPPWPARAQAQGSSRKTEKRSQVRS